MRRYIPTGHHLYRFGFTGSAKISNRISNPKNVKKPGAALTPGSVFPLKSMKYYWVAVRPHLQPMSCSPMDSMLVDNIGKLNKLIVIN
jgi:hypothetical protein